MNVVDKHPPADTRCQIYIGSAELFRCQNEGTHWEKWGGCSCTKSDPDVCEADYFSWECDGEHDIAEVLNGAA